MLAGVREGCGWSVVGGGGVLTRVGWIAVVFGRVSLRRVAAGVGAAENSTSSKEKLLTSISVLVQ